MIRQFSFYSKCRFIFRIIFILAAFATNSNAQSQLLLGPQPQLIQSHFSVNPSFIPSERFTISVPPLLPPFPVPGFGFSFSSSAFGLSEVIKPGRNGLTLLDTKSLLESANAMNTVAASFHAEMLNLGYRLNDRSFIGFQISNRAELNWEYSQNIMELLLKGNGAAGILGEEIAPRFYLDAIHYTSIGIGYATSMKDGRLKAGIRLRYLAGQEHIKTEKSDLSLFTDANDFSLRGSANILIRTSGLQNGIFQGENKLLSSGYLLGKGNSGAGIDAGISYSINDNWQLTAAVNDAGFIRWQRDVTTYSSKEPGATVEFQGVDLTEYQNETITIQEAFDELTDSLGARLDIEEDQTSYTSMLNLRTVASVTYAISKKQSASLFIENTMYDQRLHPDISLSYSFSMGKWFRSSLAWSYINRTAGNLGLFLSAHPGAFQWYLCSDNILGIIFYDRYNGIPVPAYARHSSLRVGFNLTIGQLTSTE